MCSFSINSIISIEKLLDLGIIYQTNIPDQKFNSNITFKNHRFYYGIDLTAKGIHIGHILNILTSYLLSKIGIEMILLIGDFTSKIGDPSFKDKCREKVDNLEISENQSYISNICIRMLNNLSIKYKVLKNSEWNNISIADYIENIAMKFNINDFENSRIFQNRKSNKNPMYLHEILYSTIQAHDFQKMFTNYNCILQLGGQDQWFNMLLGSQLIRLQNKNSAYVITTPLIIDKNNQKIGKTSKNSFIINTNHNIYYIFNHLNNIEEFIYNQFKNILNIIDDSNKCIKSKFINICMKIICKDIKQNEINQMTDIFNKKSEYNDAIIIRSHLIDEFNAENLKFKSIMHKFTSYTSSQINLIIKSKQLIINGVIIQSVESFYKNINSGINIVYACKNIYIFKFLL